MAPMRTQEGNSMPEPQLGSAAKVGGTMNCVNRGPTTGSRARSRKRKFQGTETSPMAKPRGMMGSQDRGKKDGDVRTWRWSARFPGQSPDLGLMFGFCLLVFDLVCTVFHSGYPFPILHHQLWDCPVLLYQPGLFSGSKHPQVLPTYCHHSIRASVYTHLFLFLFYTQKLIL